MVGAEGSAAEAAFGGRLGLGGILIVGLLSLIFGRNFFTLFQGGSPAPVATRSAPSPAQTAKEQPEVEFVKFVLNDVQAGWDKTLPAVSSRETGSVSGFLPVRLRPGADSGGALLLSGR